MFSNYDIFLQKFKDHDMWELPTFSGKTGLYFSSIQAEIILFIHVRVCFMEKNNVRRKTVWYKETGIPILSLLLSVLYTCRSKTLCVCMTFKYLNILSVSSVAIASVIGTAKGTRKSKILVVTLSSVTSRISFKWYRKRQAEKQYTSGHIVVCFFSNLGQTIWPKCRLLTLKCSLLKSTF